MAPARSGQLDQISEAIGELKGKFDGLDRYTHEREHGINNISQKIDALAVKFGSDLASLEARMDSRLRALETTGTEMSTAKRIGVWIVQTVFSAVAVLAALWAGGHRP